MVKKNWKLPEPPAGFAIPVAFYNSDNVNLDWTRDPENDFASEYDLPIDIPWPFVEGTQHVKHSVPDKELWASVGILPIW